MRVPWAWTSASRFEFVRRQSIIGEHHENRRLQKGRSLSISNWQLPNSENGFRPYGCGSALPEPVFEGCVVEPRCRPYPATAGQPQYNVAWRSGKLWLIEPLIHSGNMQCNVAHEPVGDHGRSLL